MADEIMVASESTAIEYKNTATFEAPAEYICTVDITTLEGKLDVMNALNGAESLSKHEGETLMVKNIVTTPGVRSRTGEVCSNTYLLLDDGRALFSQSDGVNRSVSNLVGLFTVNGVCDFGDGIALRLASQVLNNGNTLKFLVPVR